ncbi:hypothetical protein [Novacetimonas hansenii]|uniref:Uncharacterized protein n=1 Tax=Novacetimonas hansenii TaxID=436 RepID=A0AAW5EUI3_NOVHA|nr:hypothetical protein [Novacetimonas hansenii]MCJ8354771.1 hypothetical protein [Novacetimonas hansenii]
MTTALCLPFRHRARALAATMAVLVMFPLLAGAADARDHSFHIPHRSHAPSPYGNVTGYEPALDKKSPEYIKTAQVCETTSAMGMYATTTAKQMSMNRTDHRRFYAQCMVSHGAWHSLAQSAGGDMGGDDSIR